MTQEKLLKLNELSEQIGKCQINIQRALLTQSESFIPRSVWLLGNGVQEIEVPESLFRLIGKLVLSEWNQRLIDLQKEFNEQ